MMILVLFCDRSVFWPPLVFTNHQSVDFSETRWSRKYADSMSSGNWSPSQRTRTRKLPPNSSSSISDSPAICSARSSENFSYSSLCGLKVHFPPPALSRPKGSRRCSSQPIFFAFLIAIMGSFVAADAPLSPIARSKSISWLTWGLSSKSTGTASSQSTDTGSHSTSATFVVSSNDTILPRLPGIRSSSPRSSESQSGPRMTVAPI
mmetsp:Transcript_7590/g.18305  ORF Transcript_7590/g.18305 Transcript_7590/m.18305 type:complete len:206 (+) Transcript_7590:3018-3635(+)